MEEDVPQTVEDLLSRAKGVDYLHLVIPDIHGIPRIKVYPSHKFESIIKNGTDVPVCTIALGIDGVIQKIPKHMKLGVNNIRIRLIIDTTRRWPWWNISSKTTALQVFCQPEWMQGGVISADPRHIALKQLKRLHDRGLDIFWGVECEYKLFKKEDHSGEGPIPADRTCSMYLRQHIREYEQIYTEMDKRSKSLGFKYEAFHTEYGQGQIEFPLSAEWGIKHADDIIRFKMLAHDIADEAGYRASFMTLSNAKDLANGFHLNHSIWKKPKNDEAIENKMFDPASNDQMSSFAKHWLAGLLHHSRGMTAITSPTVNCYRRLHKPACPTHCDWGIDNRLTNYRFKSDHSNKSTYIENRSPSSASNPYLCLALTIAAGLDGVDKALPLVDNGSQELGLVPHTLPEALEELKKDECLSSALGDMFMDWYNVVKEEEYEKLKFVDIKQERLDDLERERQFYFDHI